VSTTNPIRDEISKAISEHEVILFMKGRPEQPMCGFSARTVAALDALGASYAAVDILPDPRIRQELSAISNWPTIPQLFVNGELVGGCDIVTEMYESGELASCPLLALVQLTPRATVWGGTSQVIEPTRTLDPNGTSSPLPRLSCRPEDR
jgi:monothiol glutaredoxin